MVPADEDALLDPEVRCGVVRAPVLVARGPKRRGEVAIRRRQAVEQAGRPDRERKPTAPVHDGSHGDIRKHSCEDVSLVGLPRGGVHSIGNEVVRNVKDRYCSVQVQPARPEPFLEAGEINEVVYGLAPGVVDLELQPMGITLGQGGCQPVVDRAADGFISGVLDQFRGYWVRDVEGSTSGINATRVVREFG